MFNKIKKFTNNFSNYFYKIKRIKEKSFVIFFHGVEEKILDPEIQNIQISFKNFKNVVDNLKQNFDILSLTELVNLKKNNQNINNKISITFDDGYRNNFEVAFPYMQQNKIPFLIYLTTDYISSENKMPNFLIRLILKFTNKKNFYSDFFQTEFDISSKKNKRKITHRYINFLKNSNYYNIRFLLKDLDHLIDKKEMTDLLTYFKSETFLNWNEIISMRDFCDFGSHTKSHYIFNEKNKKDAINQLVNSKKEIISKLGKCEHFALPNGNINAKINDFIKVGNFPYDTLATTEKKFLKSSNDIIVPRFGISNSNSDFNLKYDLWKYA